MIAATARAASSVLTVTRTSSLPAACSARTCAAVAAASAVSVLVIDWTTIGWALPTGTPPTLTVTVGRRVLTGRKYSAARSGARLEELVLQNDAQRERRQAHPARHAGSGVLRERRMHSHPQHVAVEHGIRERDRIRRQQQQIGRASCRERAAGGEVGRPRIEVHGVFREEDLELDRSRPGLILGDRGRGDRNADRK